MIWKIKYWFNLFNRYMSVYSDLSFCEFWQIVSFKELVHLILVIKLVGIEWSTYSFTILLMSMGLVVKAPLLFLILVICVFSFSVNLARGLSILLTFLKNQIWFYWFSWLVVLSCTDFDFNHYFFCFAYFGFNLLFFL